MKQYIVNLVETAVNGFMAETGLSLPDGVAIQIERTRDERYGEFASNISLNLAKTARLKPRDLAAEIVKRLPESEYIEKVEIAGPGFINFFLTQQAYLQVIPEILDLGEKFGKNTMGTEQHILLEFVSSCGPRPGGRIRRVRRQSAPGRWL